MLTQVLLGLSLGFSAGISPGPLLTLVITASLRSGWAGGLRVAVAPLLTDALIISVCVLVIGRFPAGAVRWMGAAGGLVVVWLGVETLRAAGRGAHASSPGPEPANPRRELLRGMVVNLLNPHPYLFWVTVGGPALVQGWRLGLGYAVAFLAPFYLMLVGSKVVVAWLVSRRADGLPAAWYRRALIACGGLLLGMGGLLIARAWRGG